MVRVRVGGGEVEPVVPGQLLPRPGVRHAHLVPGQFKLISTLCDSVATHLACSPGLGSPSCRPEPHPGLGTPRLGRGSRGSSASTNMAAEVMITKELSSLGAMSHSTALCRNISTS